MTRLVPSRNAATALCFITALGGVMALPVFAGDIPAFPGAEGYGAKASGGRGGRVIAVTNLNDSGPGSLRAAIDAQGARTVVFHVSGNIPLGSALRIKHGDLTIAGQTAPGGGICLKGALSLSASNVVIRYLRVRPDPSVGELDAITCRGQKDIILDHVSASWSSDEILSIYHNDNVTVQWCMITEACVKFKDGQDTGHRFGGIWGNNYGTYHHNLIAHNDSRNPRWASGAGFNDYRNNVLYNWGYNSSYGGGAVQDSDPSRNFTTINMVANYHKAGPATKSNVARRIAEPSADKQGGVGSWYVAGNEIVGFPEVTTNNWLGIDGDKHQKLEAPWKAMPINEEPPAKAYEAVLQHSGCSLPKRDAVDQRIIEEVRTGTATHGRNGIITTPEDVGGWPTLKTAEAPEDSDNDGMPDEWEVKFQLNPHDATDATQDKDKDGYTNVEEYLNGTDPTVFVDYTKSESNLNTLN